MANVKNYTEQGGDKTVIGGTLDVPGTANFSGTKTGINEVPTTGTTGQFLKKTASGCEFSDLPDASASAKGIAKQAANVAAVAPAGDEPTALETAFNGLLTALKTAGLMVADS